MSRLLSFFGGNSFDDTFYAGWSLRKIRSAYSGNCIQVRRSSDNALLDIGFDVNGNLDTTALLSFVGAGNGFVRTMYNQSSTSGLNLLQTTNATQPQIVNAGSLYLMNSRPTIYFAGNRRMPVPSSSGLFNFLQQAGFKNTTSVVFKCDSLADTRSIFGNKRGNAAGYHVICENLGKISNRSGQASPSPITNISADNAISSIPTLAITCCDIDNPTGSLRSKIFVNDASPIMNNTSVTISGATTSTQNFHMGDDGRLGSIYFLGNISELIVYDKEVPISGLKNNQKNYYGI